jgi:hypothetical protein
VDESAILVILILMDPFEDEDENDAGYPQRSLSPCLTPRLNQTAHPAVEGYHLLRRRHVRHGVDLTVAVRLAAAAAHGQSDGAIAGAVFKAKQISFSSSVFPL